MIGRIEIYGISQMHEMRRAVDWIYCEFCFVAKACFTVKQSTFAYELGLRQILYRFVSTKNVRLGSEQQIYFREI